MYNFNTQVGNTIYSSKFLDANANNLENSGSPYGSLPSKFRSHNRTASTGRSLSTVKNSDLPKTGRKTSVFSGIASKLRQTFDLGGSKENLHRPLRPSLSDLSAASSTGCLDEENRSFKKQGSVKFRPRLLQNIYSSQRRISTKKKPELNKNKQNFFRNNSDQPSYDKSPNFHNSSPSSSVPSSPEFYRTQSYDERFRPDMLTSKASTTLGSDNIAQTNLKYASINKQRRAGKTSPVRSPTSPNALEGQVEDNLDIVNMKLAVMGAERVGKSAITVRFLTKRFIGEYVPKVESVNPHDVTIAGKNIRLQVWDSSLPEISPPLSPEMLTTDLSNDADNRFESAPSSAASSECEFSTNDDLEEDVLEDNSAEDLKALERLEWADGIVLVYSICDIQSFKSVQNMVRFIRGHTRQEFPRELQQSMSTPNHRQHKNDNRDSGFLSGTGSRPNSGSCETSPNAIPSQNRPPLSQIPILIVGNKVDLQPRRQVTVKDCRVFATAYGCLSRELSASDDFECVFEAFQEIIEAVLKSAMPSTITRLRTMVRKIRHRRNKST